jgi:hypothetical protein
VCSHRLEGSRFGLRPNDLAIFVSTVTPTNCAKAGGSRERPRFRQGLWPGNASKPGVNAPRLGDSREQSVEHFKIGLTFQTKLTRSVGCAPKRFPSRR